MASKKSTNDIDAGHRFFDPAKLSSFQVQPTVIKMLAFFATPPEKRSFGNEKKRAKGLEGSESDMEAAAGAFAAAIEPHEKNGQLQEGKSDCQSRFDKFGMANLEETINQYEKTLEHFSAVHYDKISKLWERTKNGKIIGFRRDPGNISETDFDLIFEYFQKWNEYVNLAVCTIQLFNVEKRFGSFEDESRCIKSKAEAIAGEKTENSPTLRQIFNDPLCFMESKHFERNQEDLLGRFHIPEVLTERTSICSSIVKRMKYLNSQMMENEVNVPDLPSELPYDESRRFKAPHKVRQALSDLNFLSDEIQSSSSEVFDLQDLARNTMMTWAATSDVAWRYGTEHIEQFPVLREYEYKRTSLLAEYVVGQRSERKLLDYFQSKKYKKGTYPKLELAVGVDRTAADFEEEWKGRWQEIESVYKTIPEIVQEIHGLVSIMRKYWENGKKELPNTFKLLSELNSGRAVG